MRRLLTPEARQRLANIKMVRPEFGQQLEAELGVQLFTRKGKSLAAITPAGREVIGTRCAVMATSRSRVRCRKRKPGRSFTVTGRA